MNKCLQYRFIESHGLPIVIGGSTVVQMDTIPIRKGKVVIVFSNDSSVKDNGIALKAAKGKIYLSDGSSARLVHIWDDPGLPRMVAHSVDSPDGELRIWNIYRITHSPGVVTEDQWTGNAGMVVEQLTANKRRYHCSNSQGDFSPTDFIVEVEWQSESTSNASNQVKDAPSTDSKPPKP